MSFLAILPLPPRDASANRHVAHWAQRHRATKGMRCAAAWHFRRARPWTWAGDKPVELEVRYHCPPGCVGYAPRDVQNAIVALKPAIDGMVDAGVVPDDSAKWVSWGRVVVTREGTDAPGVYVTVRVATATGPREATQVQGNGDERTAEAMG